MERTELNHSLRGFPGGASGKESTCQSRRRKRLRSLHWEDSLGVGNGHVLPVFLPGKFHGQSSLMGFSLWGHKESDMTERVCTHHSLTSDKVSDSEECSFVF